MDLNNPDVRQDVLRDRLASGGVLVAAEIASEFGVSVDTVRRDLIALESAGQARRVRGGAVPIARPADPMQVKLAGDARPPGALINVAVRAIADAKTILLDGGMTVLAIARALRPAAGLLVVTPSPWVAISCLERGIEVMMLGGRMSPQGGMNVGLDCERQLSALAADVAVLGACGLDAEFGLSSDDLLESAVKAQMARSARQTIVVTGRSKIGVRARHRTLAPAEIDLVVTDAEPALMQPFGAHEVAVTHA